MKHAVGDNGGRGGVGAGDGEVGKGRAAERVDDGMSVRCIRQSHTGLDGALLLIDLEGDGVGGDAAPCKGGETVGEDGFEEDVTHVSVNREGSDHESLDDGVWWEGRRRRQW